MKIAKRIASLALATTLVAGSLVACGGGNNNAGSTSGSTGSNSQTTSQSTSNGEKTTIEFWTISLSSFDKFFNEMFEAYYEVNPNVEIKWVDVPYDDIQQKLVTAVAGGTAPDVVNLNTQFALTLGGKGALVDLAKEATSEQIDIYFPTLFDSASIGDARYAFPWYASPDIGIYNKALFEQAGMEVPNTIDEALAMCDEFYEKTGAYLFLPDEYFNLLVEYNVDILSGDKSEAAFNTDKAKELIQEFQKHTEKGSLPKVNWGSWDESLKLYETSKLAMISSSGSSVNRIKDEAPDVYDVTDITTPLVGPTGLSRNPLMNVVVPEASKNHELAIEFANFITNDYCQLAFCHEASIFPSTKEAAADDFFTADSETLEGRASAMSAEASLTSADYSLGVGNQTGIQTAINTVYEAYIINGEDLDTALARAVEDVNKLLAENEE